MVTILHLTRLSPRRSTMPRITLPLVLSLALVASPHADWAQYGADASRSNVCDAAPELPLHPVWELIPSRPPAPAWPEPGKELHRLDFDYAFQPVMADGAVFAGSSSDDAVRAVDARTGTVLWRLTLNGPIRFAPVYGPGRLYVGADDGYLYCLNARDGAVEWRFRAAPDDDLLIGNGRMISRWPVRGGPVLDNGILYVAAGMWPAHGIHLYALDANDGTVRWHNGRSGTMYMDLPHPTAAGFSGVCPQGHLLVHGDDLIVPAGRSVPAVFDKNTGDLRYYSPAVYRTNGGHWATAAEGLLFNPRHGNGPDIDVRLGEAEPADDDGIEVYLLANGMTVTHAVRMHRVVVDEGIVYGTGGGRARAVDLDTWKSKGLDEATRWQVPQGRTYCVVKAGEVLLLGGRNDIRALSVATGNELWRDETGAQVRGIAVDDGRVVAGLSDGRLRCYDKRSVEVPVLRVDETKGGVPAVHDRAAALAARVVALSGIAKGYALVMGPDAAAVAAALAMRTDLRAVALLDDSSAVAGAREWLTGARLYGADVWCTHVTGEKLPFAPYFADLIVVNASAPACDGRELYRVLRPCGGVLCMPGIPGRMAKRLARSLGARDEEVTEGEDMQLVRRGALPGAGEWRFQWADAGRSRVGDESRLHTPLDLLWFGKPGPQLMMSRHWGTSTPLSVDGRMFVTGQNHIIAYNAYNGTPLWTVEVPGAGRKESRWRSANFVATDSSLFVVKGTTCLRIDQRSGATLAAYGMPDEARIETAARKSEMPASVSVAWPTEWMVAGPLPKGTTAPPAKRLATIPQSLTVDQKQYPLQPLSTVDGWLDLTCLYGGYGFEPLAAGEKPGKSPRGRALWDDEAAMRVAVAFAPISCPRGGTLTIGAGADYWMEWYLDGERIYTTWPKGNAKMPFAITNHVFQAEVSAGEHVLAVVLQAGSEGFRMISAAGSQFQSYWD
ncbi:MAG: PQQ-binding-like beta-propeller repeat protein, partial [Chitinivibrionales bacterium]|nr:PQQ-binding-like beta-propeller repeat protein [Chitinivibrionales bacterium]